MITIEELKKCKDTPENLIEAVKARIDEVCSNYDEHNYMEDGFTFEYNGVSYDVITLEESSWDDEGKYQYQYITYQLISFDKNIKSWACKDSIIDKFNLIINLSVTRSGSYFSDYYYSYDKPTIQFAKIKHIPEQIIPAHDKVVFVD